VVQTLSETAVQVKAKLFRGFGDPSRLSILDVLRQGPHAVGEIVELTGLSQSNTSNHLACLRECGLVLAEQQGRHVVYRLSDERVEALLALGEDLLRNVAQGVYRCSRYGEPTENE
jgi:DNA-binding transcriptional ArsR family regulator